MSATPNLERKNEPVHRTVQLTSTGRRSSPVHDFDAGDGSITEFQAVAHGADEVLGIGECCVRCWSAA